MRCLCRYFIWFYAHIVSCVADIDRKLTEIYDDLSSNVTRIYGRQDLHLAIDLVYHAPLRFWFNGDLIKKAYPEVLIIGDTRTGKTKAAEALMEHYGLGVTAQSESMSFAGLVGGCQQMFDKAWDVTWGKLPQNNRRLVIIDEATGMSKEMIASLSSIRSQGVACIEKISSQKTEAKTRMLWLSNPRDGLTVNEYSSGVEVIKSLTDQPEDIARWDMALVVGKTDVALKAMDHRVHKKVPHVYTAKRCHDLILWAWSREPDEVNITKDAEGACYEYAEKMAAKYSSDFTLVVGAEQRLKLARLATSLAARLFCTTDGKRIDVEACHVVYIFNFLSRIYDSEHFGYDTWSENKRMGEHVTGVDLVEGFMRQLGPKGCVKLLSQNRIQVRDIEECMGITTDEAKAKVSLLWQNNALKKSTGNFYIKAPQFNQMLKAYGRTGEVKKGEF
jgi:hypothetical protein